MYKTHHLKVGRRTMGFFFFWLFFFIISLKKICYIKVEFQRLDLFKLLDHKIITQIADFRARNVTKAGLFGME